MSKETVKRAAQEFLAERLPEQGLTAVLRRLLRRLLHNTPQLTLLGECCYFMAVQR